MSVILGIDMGGSTTKIVAFSQDNDLLGTLQVKADDQLTSLYGALGHFLKKYNIALSEVSEIALTGVGASFVDGNIYDIPTQKIAEFQAIGLGGVKLAGMEQALVVSMGTGTAYVRVSPEGIKHIGGSGVGGGTLVGLSTKMINEADTSIIAALAKRGDLSNVDLSIGEISRDIIPGLPSDATAANFAKMKSTARNEDISLGLINMILQTIGMLAVFACADSPVRDVVLTGALAELPQIKEILLEIGNLYKLNFIVPPEAIYATAIGAVCILKRNMQSV